jgi:hypothetical protein
MAGNTFQRFKKDKFCLIRPTRDPDPSGRYSWATPEIRAVAPASKGPVNEKNTRQFLPGKGTQYKPGDLQISGSTNLRRAGLDGRTNTKPISCVYREKPTIPAFPDRRILHSGLLKFGLGKKTSPRLAIVRAERSLNRSFSIRTGASGPGTYSRINQSRRATEPTQAASGFSLPDNAALGESWSMLNRHPSAPQKMRANIGQSALRDTRAAAMDIARQISQPGIGLIIAFVAGQHDLATLSEYLNAT